jgi:hypothetical protein
MSAMPIEMTDHEIVTLPDGIRVWRKRDDNGEPRGKGPVERAERAERRRREREEFEKTWGKTDETKVGKSFNDFIAEADHDASEDTRHAPTVEHHASKVADLLVEAGSFPTREQALAHLLHHRNGAALLRRLNKRNEDYSMKHDNWQKIATDHGVIAIAKMVTAEGAAPGSLDEHTFTKLVTEHAQRAHPDLTPEQAFSKIFGASTDEGSLLRRAHALTKAWPAPMSIEPTFVGGTDALLQVSDPAPDAYKKLVEMAERQRRDGETAAAAFMRVYLDPANASLAAVERAQNRPNGGAVVVG